MVRVIDAAVRMVCAGLMTLVLCGGDHEIRPLVFGLMLIWNELVWQGARRDREKQEARDE